MARIDEDPDERDQKPLQLVCNVECPNCDTVFDHVFTAADGVFEMEDLVDAPRENVTCPNGACGHVFEAEWEGWMAHEDAG